MIDYDKPDDDSIVAEVHRACKRIAARFNYDLRAIFEYYQRRQATEPTLLPGATSTTLRPQQRRHDS